MAKYKCTNSDCSIVQDTDNGNSIPVADGQGGFQGDNYRVWVAAGNKPDPYVAPSNPTTSPVAMAIPVIQSEPDTPASGSVIYTLATDGITYIKTSTGNITAVSEK